MRITYEIITPESAEQGDVAEQGFLLAPYGLQEPLGESIHDSWKEWTLAEAERFLGRGGMEDCGRWFAQADGHTNYQTGAETRYSLHPSDSITVASYDRLKRIFCL